MDEKPSFELKMYELSSKKNDDSSNLILVCDCSAQSSFSDLRNLFLINNKTVLL
jgi:hypothetical protein